VTETIPLFPLGSVLLPGGPLSLHIFEPRYRELTTDLLNEVVPDQRFGVITIRQGWEVGEDNVDSLHDVGCTAVLSSVRQLAGGRYDITATGERRFRLLQIDRHAAPYLMALVEWLPDTEPDNDTPDRRQQLRAAAQAAHARYRATGIRGQHHQPPAEDTDDATLAYRLADDCVLPVEDRQALLDETNPLTRLRMVRRMMLREAEFLRELRAIPAPLTEFAEQPSVN
jgi:Lon protease-like protein